MNRRYSITLLINILLISYGYAQVETNQPDFPLRPLSQLEQLQLMALPELRLPEGYPTRDLPAVVDNSTQPYMRPVFQQDQYCCGQAACIAYNFTYEMDRVRDLPANVPENQYPTHFSWNFANGGNGWYGVSFLESIRILKEYGMPSVADYGGTLSYGGPTRWMSGYDQWFNGMHNRITEAYQLLVGDPEGLQVLKGWLYDHLEGSAAGGLASFYAQYMSASNTLPPGTPEAGKYVLTTFGGSPNHAMTIVGYNDLIRWDYNYDGQYTNDIDINGDNVVNMKDWEIGGFKMVQSYGGVPNWGDQGYAYMMYKTVADNLGSGGIWNHSVYVLDVKENCEPKLTARIVLKHTSRNKIKVLTGISGNVNATIPEIVTGYNMFDYQGGGYYMQGGSSEEDKTIEFGLDLSPFLSEIDLNQNVKIFLQVVEDDPANSSTGEIVHFSVYDHTAGGVEVICPQNHVQLVNNDTTTLSVTRSFNFDRVHILDQILPSAPPGQPYSHQMNAGGGTQPYWWELDKTYSETNLITPFPSASAVQLTPSNTTNGFVTQPLDFSFPFYDSSFTSVTLHVDGYLMFDEQLYPYPYFIDDNTLFMITRHISPFMNQHQEISYSQGCGMWYEGDASSAIFRWKTVLTEDPAKQFNYAVKLFPNGDIRLYYGSMNGCGDFLWLSGIAEGDGDNYQYTAISNKPSVTANSMFHLDRYDYPEELVLEQNGLLHGTPQEAYSGISLKIKATDNNFIYTSKDFLLSSCGIIVQDSVIAGYDEIITYGEEVELSVSLFNNEPDTIPGAQMVIHIDDPYIILTDSTESIGNLIPGEGILFNRAFSFEVADNIPDNHLIIIETLITSDTSTWENNLFHYAYAPVVTVLSVEVEDENGRLDPGDSTALKITFQNSGGAAVESLYAILSSSDPYLDILMNVGNVPILLPNGLADLFYTVTVDEQCPAGHQINFNLSMMGSNNYSSTDHFSLAVGLFREDFETGDFTLFPWGCSGARDWGIDTYSPREGSYSARSGAITHNEESVMIVDMEVLIPGEISFYKRVICEDDTSSANNYDYLAFKIDGIEQGRWDGNSGWSLQQYTVTEGFHRFEWVYHKDLSVNYQMDAAWVDDITFPSPVGASPELAADPQVLEFILRPEETGQDTIILWNEADGMLEFTADPAGMYPVLTRDSNGSRNIEGSYLVSGSEKFHTGQSYTWNFRTYNGGNDNEWVKQIYISFPDGFEITAASDFTGGSGGDMVFQGPLGNGVMAHWYGEDANGWGVIHMGETAASDISLNTYPGIMENVSLHYEVMGEVYGGPPHTVTGNIHLLNMGPVTPWLSLSDSVSAIPGRGSDSLVVSIDATGLEDGTYEAWILLQDNFGHEIIIPVTLTVDQFLGNEEIMPAKSSIQVSVFPNPAHGQAVICVELQEPGALLLEISNPQGQPVRKFAEHASLKTHRILFDGFDGNGYHLPDGIYMINVLSGGKRGYSKLIVVD